MQSMTLIALPVNSASVATTAIRPADRREAREWLNVHWPAPAAEAPPEVPATNPRDRWGSWADADTWEIGPEAPDGEPSPSWDATRFEPTAGESAELAGDDAEYDVYLDRLAGERLESAFGEFDAYADAHPDELVRAVGCIEARRA